MRSALKFIESLCYINNQYPLHAWHQRRINRAFDAHFPNNHPHALQEILPQINLQGRHKVRVEYDQETYSIDIVSYQPKKVRTLRLVTTNSVSYVHKYSDRSQLSALYKKRQQADDILIVKQGKPTDTYYANVVLWDGSQWITPNTYLLNGVKRQYLLAENIIHEKSISVQDIPKFEKVSLINAMLDPGEIELPTSRLIFT